MRKITTPQEINVAWTQINKILIANSVTTKMGTYYLGEQQVWFVNDEKTLFIANQEESKHLGEFIKLTHQLEEAWLKQFYKHGEEIQALNTNHESLSS